MSDTTLPAVSAKLPAQAGEMLTRVKGLAAQPAVAKSLPWIGIIASLALVALAWMAFATGPQRALFSGLSDNDKGAVADSLNGAGIKYNLDSASGALTVSESDYYRAKMMLAQAGLPKSAPDGDAMIANLPMGASRAVEGERLRGAREMDLARTIEAIDAVDTAKVHLAVEQPSVFVREAAPAGASVMLRLHSGRTLSDGQVSAIVNLVASSVQGLSADNVSVVDQAGHLLSRKGAGNNAADAQIEIQQKIEQRYQEQIAKLLTPIVGPDGFTAEVHADLDFTESQATRESFPKDNAVIAREQGGWQNDGSTGPTAGAGIPGALANTPPAAGQVSTQAPNQPAAATPPGATPATAVPQPGTTAAMTAGKTSESYDRTFQLGHEVSVTKNPSGVLKRLSLAVALKQGDKARGTVEMKQIEQLVKSGVGFDQGRGDQFALTSRTFADVDAATKPKWWEASWVSLAARNGTAFLIALVMFFGIVRPLMKRRAAMVTDEAAAAAAPRPEIRDEIAKALASEASVNPAQPVTLAMIEAAPGYADRAALIRNFVRQDPERAALVVRDLIRSDMGKGVAANG